MKISEPIYLGRDSAILMAGGGGWGRPWASYLLFFYASVPSSIKGNNLASIPESFSAE